MEIEPEDDYRILEDNELIEAGDMFTICNGGWIKARNYGMQAQDYHEGLEYRIGYSLSRLIENPCLEIPMKSSSIKKSCNCTIQTLMRTGCRCKGI